MYECPSITLPEQVCFIVIEYLFWQVFLIHSYAMQLFLKSFSTFSMGTFCLTANLHIMKIMVPYEALESLKTFYKHLCICGVISMLFSILKRLLPLGWIVSGLNSMCYCIWSSVHVPSNFSRSSIGPSLFFLMTVDLNQY